MTVQELNEGIVSKIAARIKGGVEIENKFGSIREPFPIDGDTECKFVMVKGGEKIAYNCYNKNSNNMEHSVGFEWQKFLNKLAVRLREEFIDNGDIGDIKIVLNKVEPLFTTNDGHYKVFDPLIKLKFIGDIIRKKDDIEKNGIEIDIKFGKCDNKKCEIVYNVIMRTSKGLVKIKDRDYLYKTLSYNMHR